MTNKNNNSSCDFSELLVSYLYGEASAAEKSRFESHALNCRDCADEISAFGQVRASVQEWRDKEFAPLRTPVFEIPHKAERTISAPASVGKVSRSWFAGLRELFSLSPARAGAAAACAALAICFGLFYVAVLAPRDGGSLAGGGESVPAPPVVASPTAVNSKTVEPANQTNANQTEQSPKPVMIPKEKTVLSNPPTVERARATGTESQKVKVVKPNALPKAAPKVSVPAQRKTPRAPEIEFSNRVEEDRSLRLMDLFDEIGKE